jgi:hypothetical protein
VQVLEDKDWVNPAPTPAELAPMLQGLVPAGEEDKAYSPDMDVVDYIRPGGRTGFLVCRAGLDTALEEGDVIVSADGRPLLLPEDPNSSNGELFEAELAASPAWQALGDQAANALFRRLDAGRQGLVNAEAYRRRAAEELANRLLGTHKSTVKLQVGSSEQGGSLLCSVYFFIILEQRGALADTTIITTIILEQGEALTNTTITSVPVLPDGYSRRDGWVHCPVQNQGRLRITADPNNLEGRL